MLVQVPESAQVSFLLQVRKADLALIFMKQEDTLMKLMEDVRRVITSKGYLVTAQVTYVGVVT